MKHLVEIEDANGDNQVYWMDTEGTTANVARAFKWICLLCLVWVLAALGMVWFIFRVIFGE